jgi:hypothetical protein
VPSCRAARIGRSLTSAAGRSQIKNFQSRSQTRVASLSAALSDVPETTRLLAEVPQAEAIREKLAEPLLFQHWDELTERAIWIASDGSHVRCVTVTGLSVHEMADMWLSFNVRISRAKFNLSPQLVREIIEAEIDVSVALVN